MKYWTKKAFKDEGFYKIVNKGIDETVTKEIKTSYKDGNWKSYDETQGKWFLKEIIAMENKMESGNTFIRRSNRKQKVTYKNGKLNGISKNLEKRSIKIEINYKNNKKRGSMKVYSKKKLVLHVIYKDGVKIKDVLKKIDYKCSKINKLNLILFI